MRLAAVVSIFACASAWALSALPAHAQAAPSIRTFTFSPSAIFNGYSASLSYALANGGGADIAFTCPSGVSIQLNGASYPCNSRQSLSRGSDSLGFTFINVSGVARTVSVRLYPKDAAGTSYDSISEEKSITVEPAFVTVQSLSASATTITSENTVTFTWEGIYAPGTNMRFDCGPNIRVQDENGNSLYCGQPAFQTDLGISGSKTLKFINDSLSNDSSVSVNVIPSIVAGSYDGSRGKQVGITVRPKAAAPDPVLVSFAASPSTVASGGMVTFSFSTRNATTTNLQFSCANVSITSTTTTAICGQPAFTPALGASATAYPLTFTNRGYSKETVRVMFLLGKENGSYLLSQSTEVTVLPIGQSAPATSTPAASAPQTTAPALPTAPGYIFTANLARGSTHKDVAALQKFLAQDKTIYPEGMVSGYFGAASEAAVKRFQKKYGIAQTGTVGPMTRAKLNVLAKP